MYAQDSFHTLTLTGQIGLSVLSSVLAAATLALAWYAMKRRRLPLRLAIALGVFFSFVWLSPQIYYTYYLTLFEGLPWQNVIKTPPGPLHLFYLLTFQERPTLSAHSKAILGWLLFLQAACHPYVTKTP
ncbi:MAG: hypothetical protein ACFB6S_10325 [Geminicoccaceae bacterium]